MGLQSLLKSNMFIIFDSKRIDKEYDRLELSIEVCFIDAFLKGKFMKNVFFALVLLSSVFTFAYPALNDSVSYNGKYTITENNMTLGFIQDLMITDLNKETNKVKILETFYGPDGSESKQEQEADISELKTKEQILDLLANCETYGGQKQKVEVVAGQFDTCYFQDEKKNEVWIGDVPFNIIKQVQFDDKANRIEVELSAFTLGQ